MGCFPHFNQYYGVARKSYINSRVKRLDMFACVTELTRVFLLPTVANHAAEHRIS